MTPAKGEMPVKRSETAFLAPPSGGAQWKNQTNTAKQHMSTATAHQWTPVQDDHLRALIRRKWTPTMIARRFGCTDEEAIARMHYVTATDKQQEMDLEDPFKGLNAFEAAMTQTAQFYNGLGESFKKLAEMAACGPNEEELQFQLSKVLPQFQAKFLLTHYALIPLPQPPPQEGTPPNA